MRAEWTLKGNSAIKAEPSEVSDGIWVKIIGEEANNRLDLFLSEKQANDLALSLSQALLDLDLRKEDV